jgi:hypothetical protein
MSNNGFVAWIGLIFYSWLLRFRPADGSRALLCFVASFAQVMKKYLQSGFPL